MVVLVSWFLSLFLVCLRLGLVCSRCCCLLCALFVCVHVSVCFDVVEVGVLVVLVWLLVLSLGLFGVVGFCLCEVILYCLCLVSLSMCVSVVACVCCLVCCVVVLCFFLLIVVQFIVSVL